MSDDPWYKDKSFLDSATKFHMSVLGTFDPPPALPTPATLLYEAGVYLCTGEGRSLPLDRIRVAWWELDQFQSGWFFDGSQWRRATRNRIFLARRNDWQPGYVDIKLPPVSSLWLSLSIDEAIDAGFGAEAERLRKQWSETMLPARLDFVFQQEQLWNTCEFEWINFPAEPNNGRLNPIERRAWNFRAPVAEIRCRHCLRSIVIPGGQLQRVREYLDGTRGTREEQIRMAQLVLETKEGRPRASERGKARNIAQDILSIPQRESHPIACPKDPFRF